MRLVDDHRIRAGQELAEAGLFQREIREQQVMVHDHDVRGLRFAARLEHAAAVEEFAAAAETVVDRRGNRAPQRVILRQVLELGEIAARARLAPRGDRAELRDTRGVASAVVQRRLEPVPAQIVVAALEQRDARGPSDDGAEQRQVAREQLVLERARTGRNDRAPAGQQHRQQIRERLADAGARLDGGMPAGIECLGDELGHLRLRRAIAEARQALGERTVGAEDVRECQRGTAR